MSSSSDTMFSKANILLSAVLSLVVAAHAAPPSTNPGGPIIISCKSPNPTIGDFTSSKSSFKGGADGDSRCMSSGIPVNLSAELTSIFQAPRASNAAKQTSMKAQCKPLRISGVINFLNAAIVVSRSPAAICVLS